MKDKNPFISSKEEVYKETGIEMKTSVELSYLRLKDGIPRLRKALIKGNLEEVKFYIQIKEIGINTRLESYTPNFWCGFTYSNPTPLFLAGICGHANIVEFLLKQGANIEIGYSKLEKFGLSSNTAYYEINSNEVRCLLCLAHAENALKKGDGSEWSWFLNGYQNDSDKMRSYMDTVSATKKGLSMEFNDAQKEILDKAWKFAPEYKAMKTPNINSGIFLT